MSNKNDKQTVFDDIKKDIQQFCTERDWDQFHGLKDLSIGLATEAAELLEVFRFKNDGECEAIMAGVDRQKVEDEIADVLFFTLRFAQKYDIDLTSSYFRKMEKNRAKYPVEKSKGSNKKYTEL